MELDLNIFFPDWRLPWGRHAGHEETTVGRGRQSFRETTEREEEEADEEKISTK